MIVTIISIVIGTHGIVTKGSVPGLEDLEIRRRVETIQTTALLRSARILKRVLKTWRDLLSSRLQWRQSANADVKNSKVVKMIIKVTVVPIVTDAGGTIPKGLVRGLEDLEIRGRPETIQILLRSARMLRRVLDNLLSIKIQWKAISSRWCEKLTSNNKNLWNMKVTGIPIVIAELRTVTKGLVKGLVEWI